MRELENSNPALFKEVCRSLGGLGGSTVSLKDLPLETVEKLIEAGVVSASPEEALAIKQLSQREQKRIRDTGA